MAESCGRCGRRGQLVLVIVPGASRAVRRGERPDNPLRRRGVTECLSRRSCPFYVQREAARREKRRAAAAARRPSYRRRVFERDGGRCIECGLVREEWEQDHVVPLVDGGVHELINIATRCRADHRSKSSQEARLRSRRNRFEVPSG